MLDVQDIVWKLIFIKLFFVETKARRSGVESLISNSISRCKIADFGLARSVSHSQSGRENEEVELCLTDYVATRWYRAPELLVASKK